MVAYKKLSNYERENISRIMVQNLINKEIQNKQDEISSRLTKLLYDKIPDDVKEFILKYPDYINKKDIDISGYDFLSSEEKNNINITNIYFLGPKIHICNVINKMYEGIEIDFFNIDDKFAKYIIKEYPDIAKEIHDLTLKEYKITKIRPNILCALKDISTVNGLMNDFPEAYEVYTNLYGVPGAKCNKSNDVAKRNNCDKIEQLRAEYNNIMK